MPTIDYGSPVVSGNVEVSASISNTHNTVNVIHSTKAGASTANIGTVPAGKIWYIVGLQMSLRNFAGDAAFTAEIQDNAGAAMLSLQQNGLSTHGIGGVADSITFDFYSAPAFTAGQSIKHYVDNSNVTSTAIVYYVEVTA